jgi:hypothetical protein
MYFLSDFSQVALEIIAPDGRGTGGYLHKVKDWCTWTTMARKMIIINADQETQDPWIDFFVNWISPGLIHISI